MTIGKAAATLATVLAGALSLPASAAELADEMSLMLVRDTFLTAHAVPVSGILGSHYDEAKIIQDGDDNYARAEQLHTANGSIALTQIGYVNAAGLYQADGEGNNVLALQDGELNYLSSTQTGAFNNANLVQNGYENRLQLDQLNGANVANVTQNGYSRLTLEQGGGSTATITLAEGDPLAPFTLTVIQPPGDTFSLIQP